MKGFSMSFWRAAWKRRDLRHILLLAAPSILALTSCYSFVGRYRGDDPRLVEIASVKEGGIERYLDDLYDPDAPGDRNACRLMNGIDLPACNELVPRGKPGGEPPDGDAIAAACDGQLLLRFGLVSDVHIREPSVKLFSSDISRDLDHVIESFERQRFQEAFQPAVYTATVEAFNQINSVSPLRFVVNLGDGIDAGTIWELYQFIYISRKLQVPFLDLLGNHDDAIFGNYKRRLAYVKAPGPDFYPVGSVESFLYMHRRRVRECGGLAPGALPLPRALGCADKSKSCTEDLGPVAEVNADHCTYCNGFDLPRLQPGSADSDTLDRCERYPGYYSIRLKTDDGSVVQLIALDTTRHEQWGASGTIDGNQLQWLVSREADSADVTLIFMHHPTDEVRAVQQELLTFARRRPVVVFSGHLHAHRLQWHGNDAGYWELGTGSLEEFPQRARIVEIRRDAGNRLYLNARAFRPRLTADDPSSWSKAKFEAAFQRCACIAARQPSAVLGPGPCAGDPGFLERSAACGYTGAVYDHRFPKEWACFRKASAQPVTEARREANVIIELCPR